MYYKTVDAAIGRLGCLLAFLSAVFLFLFRPFYDLNFMTHCSSLVHSCNKDNYDRAIGDFLLVTYRTFKSTLEVARKIREAA